MPELVVSPEPVVATPKAPARDPRVGQQLGKYRIHRRLGQGGMGVVYEAEDTLLKRRVALKFLPHAVAADAHTWQRFLLEAQAAARLNHPNAVAIYEIDQRDATAFLVMEYVDGGSTQDYLKAHGPFAWPHATRVIAEVCHGLAAAHRAGLIHRDIKPANILLQRVNHGTHGTHGKKTTSEEGSTPTPSENASSLTSFPCPPCVPWFTPKLADFGLAKATDASTSSITGSNAVVGTPSYMSPEQCQSEGVDARSDLYSLGATFYALLVGKPPFGNGGPLEVMFAHCSKEPPDPRETFAEVPEACTEIVKQAMDKEPARRYQSADEMLHALEAVLALPEAAAATPPRAKRPSTVVAIDTVTISRDAESPPTKPAGGQPPAWRTVPLIAAGLLMGASIGLIAFIQPGPQAEDAAPKTPPVLAAVPPREPETAPPKAIPPRPAAEPKPTPPPRKPPREIVARPQRRPRILFVLPPHTYLVPEYAPVRRILEDIGVDVHVASATTQPIKPEPFAQGQAVVPDLGLDRARMSEFDALVLCGGKTVGEYVGESLAAQQVRHLIQDAHRRQKVLAAFGLANGVLARAGVLRGEQVAAPPWLHHKLQEEGAVLSSQSLVVSNRVITAREPQIGPEFARAVGRALGLQP